MRRRGFALGLAGLMAARNAPARAPDFAAVVPGYRLTFPQDHGAHALFRTEWWYATGWLKTATAREIGFQLTFFRTRTGMGEDNPSAFAPRQLMMAHAAVADPATGRLLHDQRVARVGFERAGFAPGDTRVWIGHWRLEHQAGVYLAQAQGQDFGFALSLAPTGPPLLHGAAGFSAKTSDAQHASYYYSQPQLSVRGTLRLAQHGETVAGSAWLDHEWSSELLPAQAQGWDWVGLNLDDGSAVMAFQLRDARAQAISSVATLSQRAQAPRSLQGTEVVFQPLRRWTSRRTGISYPVEWELHMGSRRLHLVPLMDDQELDSRRSTGTVYWEGAVRVLENGKPTGRGYLELTGYGEKISLR